MVLCIPMILRSAQITTRTSYVAGLLRNNTKCLDHAWASVQSKNISWRNYSAAQQLEKRFTDKHEWVTSDGKIATVGITHYAQDALGDVVYAQLPDIGSIIEQNEECGALESVKAASELYSPVSGKVVEKNMSVEESPGLINQSCYDKGWLFKVELTNLDQLMNLMNEIDYDKFLKSDSH